MSVIVHTFCGGCGKETQQTNLCAPCEGIMNGPSEEDSYLSFYEEEESYVGRDPKTLTLHELYLAQEEVDEDRKHHCRSLKGRAWTTEDEEIMENMNDWAKTLLDEIMSRQRK
jgi:hypothetical protein